MIRISFWVCAICITAWWIYVGVICIIEPVLKIEIWGIIFAFTIGIAIVSFFLSYIGGYAVKGNRGAVRLAVFISLLWVVGSLLALEDNSKHWTWYDYFIIGIVPVVIYLGILWVISGYIHNNKHEEDKRLLHNEDKSGYDISKGINLDEKE